MPDLPKAEHDKMVIQLQLLCDRQVCQLENLNDKIHKLEKIILDQKDINDDLLQERSRVTVLKKSRDRYKDVLRSV